MITSYNIELSDKMLFDNITLSMDTIMISDRMLFDITMLSDA
jgi:hypothetical protein